MENIAVIIFTIFMFSIIISAILLVIGLIKKDSKFKPSKKVIGICIGGCVISLFFYGAVQTPETKARIEAENKAKEEKEALEKSEKEALKLKEEKADKEQNEDKQKEQAEKDKQEEENKDKEDVKKEEVEKNEALESKNEFKLKHGEFLSAIINDNVVVIKAKIEPSYSNKATINQNGYNIEDIVKNQGGDKFREIQYWAVAEMSDGSESKVISFTLNDEMITKIKNGNIPANTIVENAEDVYILPSLQK